MLENQAVETNECIRNPGRIQALLGRLLEEQPFLIVTFPESHRHYASALLALDIDSNHLLLDELKPPTGHQRVQADSILQIHARLAGVDLHFEVSVSIIKQQDGIHCYLSQLPEQLTYRQRREHVRVPFMHNAHAQFLHENRRVEAQLLDLSSQGFGGVLRHDSPLHVGQRYTCTLLIKEDVIRTTAELRYLAKDPAQQHRFGALFHQPSPAAERQINRLVMQLQREQARL